MKHIHILALMVIVFAGGCDEGMNMVKPVVMEEPEVPTEQVETPGTPAQESPQQAEDPITTLGEIKQPEESETEVMEEQEIPDPEVEPEPDVQEPETPEEQEEMLPATDIDISAILPPEHVRRETPAQANLARINFDFHLALDPEEAFMQPNPHIAHGKPADQISLLPLSERQTAYDNFVLWVNLPHFIEASNKMVERTNKISEAFNKLVVAADYSDDGYEAFYRFYDEHLVEKENSLKIGDSVTLSRVYFEENPEDRRYPAGTHQGESRYWMVLEYIRLQIQYPNAEQWRLFEHFRTSAKNGWVLGLDSPIY